jgi:iron complex outermembrane recepter protein
VAADRGHGRDAPRELPHDDFGPLQFLPIVGTVQPNPPFGRIPRRRFTGEPDYDGSERNQVLAGYLARHRIADDVTVRQNMRFGFLDYGTTSVYGVGFAPDMRTLLRIPFRDHRDATMFLLDTQADARWSVFGLENVTLLGVDYARMTEDEINETGTPSQIDIYARSTAPIQSRRRS